MADDQPTPATADEIEEIFAGDDRTTVDVYVAEWKKTIRLRQITGAQSVAITQIPGTALFQLIAWSAIDAQGSYLFKDPDRLKGKSAGALKTLQDAALKLNGFSAAAVAAAKNG